MILSLATDAPLLAESAAARELIVTTAMLRCFYVMMGSVVALAFAKAHETDSRTRGIDMHLGSAFVLIFGAIMLWPMLVALAVAEKENN